MKLNFKVLLAATIALIFLVELSADAQSNNSRMAYESAQKELSMNERRNLPSTQQELWERILTLLKTYRGALSKQQVEKVIGVLFEHTRDAVDAGVLGAAHIHSYEQSISHFGMLKIEMLEARTGSTVSFAWANAVASTNGCLNFESVSQDLGAMGFVEGRRSLSPHSPLSYITFMQLKHLQDSRQLITDATSDESRSKALAEYEKKIPLLIVVTPLFVADQCITEFTVRIPSLS